ncbi:methyltransferase domain-containing protein [Actinosynnema sp. NPDC023587]|uniref:class I SAM-dependent methyltransferase n=1 Tax=Actinosynnema sp. NPDC023587 TaxID=3154695 RepID=UPI003406A5C7
MSDLPETFDDAFRISERSEWLRRAFPPLLDADLPAEVEPFSFVPSSGLEEISSAVRVGPGGLVVDVACGRGGPGMWVARRVGAALCGVDGSTIAVAAATRRRAAFGPGLDARFVVGDLAATGLADGVADAVMCVDAFQFAEDHDLVARELHRVLRPGGRLVLTCWEARERGDTAVADRFADLRCGEVLRDNGFTDVDVTERPAWEQRRRAVYEAALGAGPSEDPGLALMRTEAGTALGQMSRIRRVLITAAKPA